jgi:hypothetical protein
MMMITMSTTVPSPIYIFLPHFSWSHIGYPAYRSQTFTASGTICFRRRMLG